MEKIKSACKTTAFADQAFVISLDIDSNLDSIDMQVIGCIRNHTYYTAKLEVVIYPSPAKYMCWSVLDEDRRLQRPKYTPGWSLVWSGDGGSDKVPT